MVRLSCRASTWFRLVVACVAALSLMPGSLALAEDLMTVVSDEMMTDLLTRSGIQFETVQPATFLLKLEGYNVLLFNETESMQLCAGFTIKVSTDSINEWNRSRRYSRAYVDSEGDAVIEADLGFYGGVTSKHVIEFIKTFQMTVKAFALFLDSRPDDGSNLRSGAGRSPLG